MEIQKIYVIYELSPIMGNKGYLSLTKLEFDGYVSNRFDTEEEAIQALINDNRHYENFIILKEVFIRK